MPDKLLEKILTELSVIKEMLSSMEKDIQSLKSTEEDLPEPSAEISKPTQKRTKDTAAADEDKDIKTIIEAIQKRNQIGLKLIQSFKTTFGLDIIDARSRDGNSRSTHYDFDVLVRINDTTSEWKHVEHKGSQQYRPIGPDEKPWAAGVQFHNGGCEKYTLAKKYSKLHYDIHIGSGSLKQEFDIKSDIPTYDEWYTRDCKVQSDPNTAFGKELKKKVRAARGPKSSLLDKRAAVLEALTITDIDKQNLIQEVLPIANEALEQKDYWLSIHGNISSGQFYTAWYPKFIIDSISEVIVKKNLDLEFEFRCPKDFTFHAILRWGKGAGFSCLRIDLR